MEISFVQIHIFGERIVGRWENKRTGGGVVYLSLDSTSSRSALTSTQLRQITASASAAVEK